MQPLVERLVQEHGNEVKVVYHHFPLSSHANAVPAAEAAEAAGEQGRFFPMLHALFENQGQLGPDLYQRLAKELGLDMNAFNASLQSHRNMGRIQADAQQGRNLNVTATPTFVLDGKLLPGAPGNYETLEATIKQELGAK